MCICMSVFQVFSPFIPSEVVSQYLISTNTKPKIIGGNKERNMENTYVRSPGKGPFSQVKPTIDKVIFLLSSFTGKLKLVIHCWFYIRLTSLGGKQFILGGKRGRFVVSCWCFISSKPRKPH